MITLTNRHSIRLSGYDYSQSGLYFITICTFHRECILGKIVGARRASPEYTRGSPTHMELNEFGKIINDIWGTLPNHHPVSLDTFQIMPNHVHFIIQIVDSGGSRPAPTLGTIVGLFKSECTKQINAVGATRGSPKIHIFQHNYYLPADAAHQALQAGEHIIRTENDLIEIREYISINPLMWHRDRNNPKFINHSKIEN